MGQVSRLLQEKVQSSSVWWIKSLPSLYDEWRLYNSLFFQSKELTELVKMNGNSLQLHNLGGLGIY